jgi:hypothetical protein
MKWLRVISTLALLMLAMSCRRPSAQVTGQGQAERPQPVSQTLSSYTPAEPYKQLVSNLLVRTAYAVDAGGGMSIEIWDLMVGPGKKTGNATLPGGAVFEVRSGQGIVTSAGKSSEVRTGATFSLDEATEFSIENRTPNGAIMIRSTLIRRKRD